MAVATEPSVGLWRLAAEALQCVDGDWDAACATLRARLDNDQALYEQLIEPLIDDAIYQAVSLAARRARAALVGPRPARADDPRGLLALARRNLLDYPLAGGKKLGDADTATLIDERNRRVKLSRANAVTARWMGLILMAKGEAPRVRDALDHAALERLWAEAERGTSSPPGGA